jgi:2-aminoethylphosphonate-pyruvate transaminase
MVKTAVILAAGLGSRLKERTQAMPKGFLPIDEKPIILHSIEKLFGAGINRIIIGTGYHSEFFEELSKKLPFIECTKNERYAATGSMYTLYNVRESIHEDFLLLESDILYDKRGLGELLKDNRGNLILSSGKTDSGDEVYIEVDEDNRLINMSKSSAELNSIYSELVGITKVSLAMYKAMCDFTGREIHKDAKLDYERVMTAVSKGMDVFVKKLENYHWCEIDDESHLNRALTKVYPRIKESEENEKP